MFQRTIDLFEEIDKPDATIIRVYFNACVELGSEQALEAGKKVLDSLPDLHAQAIDLLNSALAILIKLGDRQDVESFFARIDRNAVSYGMMMHMYLDDNQPEKVFQLHERMNEEKIEPNDFNFCSMISACGMLGDPSLSESILAQIPTVLFMDPWIQNGLVNMWVSNRTTIVMHEALLFSLGQNRLSRKG
jgi:pentatricopeptide repeat protein